MIENLPVYISFVFIITTLTTLYLFYKAANKNIVVLLIILVWLVAQIVLGLNKFYTITKTVPPRFTLLVAPPLFIIFLLFATSAGRRFIDGLNPKWLTLLHTVRIPVEIVLFWLFVQGYVPKLMTFEGHNFDILSGITAPIITWVGYYKGRLGKPVLLLWNIICLGLLLNIVIMRFYPHLSLFNNWLLTSRILPCCIFRLCGYPAALCRWYCCRTLPVSVNY